MSNFIWPPASYLAVKISLPSLRLSREPKMGKLSKFLLNSLFVSSATAQSFQVTDCNDETNDVSLKNKKM